MLAQDIVPFEDSLPEFTAKAVITGVALGLVFGAANAYLGLRVPGVLAASGLVAGEGLAGVLVAALVAFGIAPKGRPPLVAGMPGEALTFLVLLAVCGFLVRAGRQASPAS